jgi:hypothetical protein
MVAAGHEVLILAGATSGRPGDIGFSYRPVG